MKKRKFYIPLQIFGAGLVAVAVWISACERNNQTSTPGEVSSTSETFYKHTPDQPISGQYIIVYKNKGTQNVAMSSDFLEKKGLPPINVTQTTNLTGVVNATVLSLDEKQFSALKTNPDIETIEQDKTVALSMANQSGSFALNTQYTPWGVKNVGGSKNGVGKVAWLLDSGVDPDHPDLTVDKLRSKSFLTSSMGGKWSSYVDEYGHGTSVAGIIAAKDNNIGTVGIAAGATIVSVKVLSYLGSGTVSGLINGINYVAANAKAGDVANISIGAGASTTLDNAVKNLASKGVFVTIAAGNGNCDCSTCSPARVVATNVFTVSGMDSNGVWVANSNYGKPVSYCAPGKYITSTYMGSTYKNVGGTSMSAPHLAGILLVTGGKPAHTLYVKSAPDVNSYPIGHENPKP